MPKTEYLARSNKQNTQKRAFHPHPFANQGRLTNASEAVPSAKKGLKSQL